MDPTPGPGRSSPPRRRHKLGALLAELGHSSPDAVADTEVGGIEADSNAVAPGDLFVAIRGDRSDGHDYLADAVERGASALVVEEDADARVPVGIQVVHVPDTRVALARLAAAWYDHPAAGLSLVGISGTVGKTSVLAMLEAILVEAGEPFGSVGSLGVHVEGETLAETGYTAPDALLLQRSLADLEERGTRTVAMEVTSHALAQARVHGLRFDLGIFTNLLPLEHQEYHGTFENYVRTKVTFFDHLAAGAPLVYSADEPAVKAIVEARRQPPIAVGMAAGADIRLIDVRIRPEGTGLRLHSNAELRGVADVRVPPLDLELVLPLLGRSNVINAALAATAALLLGAPREAITRALAAFPPPRRRVEMIHQGDFLVVDDTVGHPESVNALFEAVLALNPRRLHVAFAVRGSRGPDINRHIAEALRIWSQRLAPATLVVTRSEEAADERNTVTPEEFDAFTNALADAGLAFQSCRRLDRAIGRVLDQAADGDLVLLLGAQGMDAGADAMRKWLAGHTDRGTPGRDSE